MKYRYQAKNREGELQVGYVDAPNRDSAASILSSHNLFVLSLADTERVRWFDRLGAFFGRVKPKDLMIFTRQLATLLEARLPLNAALRTLREQTSQPVLGDAIEQISEDISGGLSFSQSLEKQKDIFNPFYINMVHSAEVIGNLEEAAGFLADYMEKEYALSSKAKSAMVYPAVVLLVFAGVAFFMVTVVFPQIGPIFEQSGVQLPFYTKALLSIANFMRVWWPGVVVAVAALFGMGLNYTRTREGRALWDELKVHIPIVKKVYVPLTVARLSNVMSMLLRGGVPITQTVEIAGLTINNVLYRDYMKTVAEEVRQGKLLSEAFLRYGEFFPPLMSQMLVVGEATGQVDKMFLRLANYYEREVDSLVGNLVDLIQPVLIVVLAVLVGMLFSSIIVPLYQLTNTIQ